MTTGQLRIIWEKLAASHTTLVYGATRRKECFLILKVELDGPRLLPVFATLDLRSSSSCIYFLTFRWAGGLSYGFHVDLWSGW